MGILDFITGQGGSQYNDELSRIFNDIDMPDTDEQKLQLEQLVQQGVLTPEQARAELLGGNSYDQMDLDGQGKQAQMAALQSLSEVGNEGGLTASDRSRLQAIQSQEQTASRGGREAIMQNAQARGMGGSGLDIMAQLQNAQDSATRQSTRDLDVAAMGQDRALQALQQAGQLGGNINQQQFGQQAQIADSRNEIAKFNAANKQQVGISNVNANNQAQQVNLQAKQGISNQNVDLRNQQQQFNKGLGQQQFGNQMQLAAGKANAVQAKAAQANADKESNMGLLGTVVGAGATVAASDERLKEGVSDFNAGDFLDSLTGHKYKYKDSKHGQGKQVGVMAQDLEREVPQMVQDTPEGKMVDYSPAKAGGPTFAALGDLHERLKRIEGRS